MSATYHETSTTSGWKKNDDFTFSKKTLIPVDIIVTLAAIHSLTFIFAMIAWESKSYIDTWFASIPIIAIEFLIVIFFQWVFHSREICGRVFPAAWVVFKIILRSFTFYYLVYTIVKESFIIYVLILNMKYVNFEDWFSLYSEIRNNYCEIKELSQWRTLEIPSYMFIYALGIFTDLIYIVSNSAQYIQKYSPKSYQRLFDTIDVDGYFCWEIWLWNFLYSCFCCSHHLYIKCSYLIESVSRHKDQVFRKLNVRMSKVLTTVYYSSNNVEVRRRIESFLNGGGSEFKENICSMLKNIVCRENVEVLLTGSAAEFYITPNKRLIGDLDLMCVRKNVYGEFENGYGSIICNGEEFCVNEKLNLLLAEDRFVQFKTSLTPFLMNDISACGGYFDVRDIVPCGAAIQIRNTDKSCRIDLIEAMRCINWPSEIKAWETRKREHNWPSNETIRKVMMSGCDVITIPTQISYNKLTLSEEMSVTRNPNLLISFSRAEFILISKWTPVQQKVYHILRRFGKDVLFTSWSSLCSYHIKTLMLWSVEERPVSWWRENDVVDICCALLQDLGDMLNKGVCRNYFLPNYNLFKHFDRSKEFITRVKVNKYCNVDCFVYWLHMDCSEKDDGGDDSWLPFCFRIFELIVTLLLVPDSIKIFREMMSYIYFNQLCRQDRQ